MILNMNGGAGGGFQLSFFNVADASALPQNAGPFEVAVLSDVPVGQWQAATTAPGARSDGTPLQAGDLWVMGSLSETDFAPGAAYQYDGSSFHPVRCAMCRDGVWTWMDSRFSLYSYNRPASSMAGGLVTCPFLMNPSDPAYKDTPVSPTIDANGVMTIRYVFAPGSQIHNCAYYFTEKVDLTPYSTLAMTGTMNDGNSNWKGYPLLCVFDDVYSDPSDEAAEVGGSCTNPVLDVSGLTGEYHIGFITMCQGNPYGTTVTLKELILK